MRGPVSLFARGFLLEALFNPKGKQRGGVAFVLGPDSAGAASEPFNANPVIAGYAIGWIRSEGIGDFRRNRASLTSALGGVGDRLIWGLLRPLAVVASLIATAVGPIAAAAALLVVYNPAEIYLRWRSLRRGLEGKKAVLQDLSRDGLIAQAPRLARLFALLIGALAGSWFAGHLASGRHVEAAAGAGVSIGGWLLLRRRALGFWRLPVTALVLGLAWFAVEMIRTGGSAAVGR